MQNYFRAMRSQPLVAVQFDHDDVYMNGVKAGFVFTSPDEEGLFLELRGAVCKRFRDRNNLVLWMLKNAPRQFPKVREHLLRHVRPFPTFKYAA